MIRQIKTTLFNGNIRQRLLAPRSGQLCKLRRDGRLMLPVFVVGKFQKNQPQHRGGILGRFQVGIGAQRISAPPEIGFQLFQVGGH